MKHKRQLRTYILMFPFPHNMNRFAKQHPRNAENSDDYQKLFEESLPSVHVCFTVFRRLVRRFEQDHVNESDQDRWGTCGRVWS